MWITRHSMNKSVLSIDLVLFISKDLSLIWLYKSSFCVLKKWVHSRIGQCGRPAVKSITLHNYIRLSWNFVHRIVSSISRLSSKMRMIGQEMAELSKKLSLLTRPSLRGGTGIFSKKNIFLKIIHNIYKSTQFLTLIPNLILVLNQIVAFWRNIA
jgi:hypothetical protein